eukprot:11611623-Karenia_brevis.AAC.1
MDVVVNLCVGFLVCWFNGLLVFVGPTLSAILRFFLHLLYQEFARSFVREPMSHQRCSTAPPTQAERHCRICATVASATSHWI